MQQQQQNGSATQTTTDPNHPNALQVQQHGNIASFVANVQNVPPVPAAENGGPNSRRARAKAKAEASSNMCNSSSCSNPACSSGVPASGNNRSRTVGRANMPGTSLGCVGNFTLQSEVRRDLDAAASRPVPMTPAVTPIETNETTTVPAAACQVPMQTYFDPIAQRPFLSFGSSNHFTQPVTFAPLSTFHDNLQNNGQTFQGNQLPIPPPVGTFGMAPPQSQSASFMSPSHFGITPPSGNFGLFKPPQNFQHDPNRDIGHITPGGNASSMNPDSMPFAPENQGNSHVIDESVTLMNPHMFLPSDVSRPINDVGFILPQTQNYKSDHEEVKAENEKFENY